MAQARSPKTQGWTCPRCGRSFTRPTKEHSCDITPLEWHLGRTGPAVREAFEAVRSVLDSLGPYQLIPLKTMVSLATTTNFAGLFFGKAFLDLNVMLPAPLDHPRVRQVQRLSAHAFAHRIRLTAAEEVDEEIAGWLRQAYETTQTTDHREVRLPSQ